MSISSWNRMDSLRGQMGLHTIGELAELLGVSRATLDHWFAIGVVQRPTHTIGSAMRKHYTREEVDEIVAKLGVSV